MIMKKRKWLYLAAATAALLQTGVMLAGVQQRASILRNGTEVVLRTVPIDPRDLMRGDYVILSYAISQLPHKIISGEPAHKSGLNYLYVVMEKQADGTWQAKRAQFTPVTDLKTNEIMIRGEVVAPLYRFGDSSTEQVTYGIERYYVPEGEGLEIEKARNEQKTDVVLSVNDAGRAAIRAIRIDGQTLYDEPLF